MGSRWPVSHTFRHAIRLLPDDITTKIPAIFLKRERQAPWNSHKILRFEAGRGGGAIGHCPDWILFVRCTIATIAAGIGITNIQPKCAVFRQYPPDFFEDFNEVLNVAYRFSLCSNLLANPVVSQAPVWGGCDATSEKSGGKLLQEGSGITDEDGGFLNFGEIRL